MLRIGDTAPDFTAETTQGRIHLHEWIGKDWCVLFSHPKNFTPVCTTELGRMALSKPEFDKRGVKLLGISTDSVESHHDWERDIEETQGLAPNYPIIGDPELEVVKLYGMLPANAAGNGSRTAADNATVRTVFVIAPDKTIRLMLMYPMTTGRNFNEILRVIDSLQLTAEFKVATPADWNQGDDVIIVPSVPDKDAQKMFPKGWRAPKPYMRIVAQPTH